MKPLIYILAFLYSISFFAQNNKVFEHANSLYTEGNYTEAIEEYNAILETDVHSADLYFNIANAHYKLNHIAPSIYYYEKALLLRPNDEDIKNNIAYARNMTIDAIDILPEVGFSRLIKNVTNTTSFDNWAKLAVGLVFAFVILFLIYYFSLSTSKKRIAFISSIACLFLSSIAVTLAFNKYKLVESDQPAIVFAQEAQIKSEPNLRSSEAFKLHEGTKVQIIDTIKNWKEIRITDGKTGWVLNTDIKMLKAF
ncbi:ion channel protein [Flavobacteriales bacterium 33_180_T64]|nr:ion channel protein [Flavobacteriales bacterium 33_180_T64]